MSSLDELLCGGAHTGRLTEFFGESASGKTQTCLQLTAQAVLEGRHAVFIDTSGSFSGRRLAQMLHGALRRSGGVQQVQSYKLIP